MTVRADGLAAVAAHQHTILYLILVFLHHLEERVYAHLFVCRLRLLRWQTVPKHVFLSPCKIVVGFEYRKIVFRRPAAELVFPYAQFVTVPALYTAVVNTECRVGDDQLLVYSHNLAETLACGTCSGRRVEREHIVVGAFKLYSVGFELHGEVVADVGWQEQQSATAVALVESAFGRIGKARDGLLLTAYAHAVDKKENVFWIDLIQ